ncbi:MAG TPA: histidine kinase [Microlunatus sp.]|nr:histidine kinase [Microlunatus sp.]
MTLRDQTPRPQAVPGSPGVAWVVGVGCWVLSLASLVLFFTSLEPGQQTQDWLFVVTDAAMAAVYGTVAALLLARRRHVVIAFLLVAAVGGGLAALGGAWRQAALVGELPASPVIESLFSTAWVPGTLSLFLVVPWLVRRTVDRAAWLRALPGLLITAAFLIVGQLIPEEAFGVVIGLLALVVGWGLVSAAAVERRRRTAGPGESEGLAWLAVGTAVMALSFVPLVLPYGSAPFWTVPALHLACQTVYPVAILAVVARQRLWGLELAVSRAAVAGALTTVLVAVYLLVSLLISQAIGSRTVAAVTATAAVVVALQPSRLWLQRHVRRMVYGEGADATAVVARLGTALGRAESSDELLASVTETLGRTLRLESVTLVSADSQVRAQWGTVTSEAEQHELTHRGRSIGSLAITTPPGEVLDGRGRASLAQLLEVVGAALALADSAADLEATRDRLTTARLRERQIIRRELHDGLVPWLAGLRLGLQGARNLVPVDPDAAAAMLTELQSELTRRIEDVRSASRSLLPPVLAELGLYAALVELVERQHQAGMTVELQCSPAVAGLALPEGLAAAAYGIASEAITNAARHSGTDRCRLQVGVDDDELVIRCTDAGSGIAENSVAGVGTRSMIERAEEQGGSVSVASVTPTGTEVSAVLPLLQRVESRS